MPFSPPHRSSQSPAHAPELARQALLDLDARVAFAPYAYVAIWLLVVVVGDLYATAPTLAAGGSAVLLVVAAARVLLHLRMPRLVAADCRRALKAFRALVIGNAALLGALAAMTVAVPSLAHAQYLVFLVGSVICAGGAMSLALDPVLRWTVPAVIIAPPATAMLARLAPGDAGLVVAAVVFYVYVSASAGPVFDDYWRAAQSALRERARAADFERLSTVDALTGLLNRRGFDDRLEWLAGASRRGGEALSLLIVDLDHFKAINDTHGHPAGDSCLVAAARAIEGAARRGTDVVARHGGEEFAIVLAATDAPEAAETAERIRAAVAGLDVDGIRFTCSVGVATTDDADPAVLTEAADAALYAAKANGRDRVATAASVPAPA